MVHRCGSHPTPLVHHLSDQKALVVQRDACYYCCSVARRADVPAVFCVLRRIEKLRLSSCPAVQHEGGGAQLHMQPYSAATIHVYAYGMAQLYCSHAATYDCIHVRCTQVREAHRGLQPQWTPRTPRHMLDACTQHRGFVRQLRRTFQRAFQQTCVAVNLSVQPAGADARAAQSNRVRRLAHVHGKQRPQRPSPRVAVYAERSACRLTAKVGVG